MLGFLTGILSDAIAPLLDSITTFSARLLRKVALFAIAGVCLVVVVIALTIAFDLWIATLAGPIIAALSVAGLYLLVAILAVGLALNDGSKPAAKVQGAQAKPGEAAAATNPKLQEQIDQVTAPLLAMLERFGLRREQLAVFAGASIAKRLGPLPLVGCAVVAGFLAGRLWKSWRHVLEAGTVLFPLVAQFLGPQPDSPAEPPPAA